MNAETLDEIAVEKIKHEEIECGCQSNGKRHDEVDSEPK